MTDLAEQYTRRAEFLRKAEAKAAAPGATATDRRCALSEASILAELAAKIAAQGLTVPAIVQPAAPPASIAAASPPARPVERSREEKIRAIAAAAPFALPAGMADRAISSGQAVDAFALAVAELCVVERVAARITGSDFPTPRSIQPTQPYHAANADSEAVARRIIEA